jgi:2-methylcitrate dehydratase PrpD
MASAFEQAAGTAGLKSAPAHASATGLDTEIARFAATYDETRVSSEARHIFARAFMDTYAAAVAGGNEPASCRALDYLVAAGQLGGTASAAIGTKAAQANAPRARLWGRPEDAPIEAAAMWNGIAGHVLDYDDVTSPLRGHPSIAMLPALTALAQAGDLDGGAMAVAFSVGFDVMCALSEAMAVEHYAKGWHSTASIGMLGATAACARLLGLGVEQTRHAVGIAVAQAAGSRANFGSDAKSFQAGHANAGAVRSVLLARQGFTAGEDIVAGRFGYLELYGAGESQDIAVRALRQEQPALLRHGLDVKKYPLCYATHRALDGVLDLRREHGLTLAAVREVRIATSRGALTPLIHDRPGDGLQAKFSMQYAVAAALLDGQVTLASFRDDAVRRPEVSAFLPAVHAREDDQGAVLPRWTHVTLTLRNGSTLERRIDALRGSAALPLTDGELLAKVEDCLRWGGAKPAPGRAAQVLRELPHRPVRASLAALG